MKQNHIKNKVNNTQAGFTLLEMLFVVGIMAMFYLLMATNFGFWRTPQYLKSAQTQLVTNIQKVRSYSLSGRQISGNDSKFYIVELATSNPRSYLSQGIAYDATLGADLLYNGQSGATNRPSIEQIPLPPTVTITGLRLTQSGITQDITCAHIVYSLPFGKSYITDCANNDIYTIYLVPSAMQKAANSTLVITLAGSGQNVGTRTVTVYGISGRVEASQ